MNPPDFITAFGDLNVVAPRRLWLYWMEGGAAEYEELKAWLDSCANLVGGCVVISGGTVGGVARFRTAISPKAVIKRYKGIHMRLHLAGVQDAFHKMFIENEICARFGYKVCYTKGSQGRTMTDLSFVKQEMIGLIKVLPEDVVVEMLRKYRAKEAEVKLREEADFDAMMNDIFG